MLHALIFTSKKYSRASALVLTVVLIGTTHSPSSALAQSQNGSLNDPNQKLDVTDLEKKYWAAKDTDFNVVQNRTFSKAGRLALTLNYGNFVNDPWSDGGTIGANLNYFLTERYGIELAYSKSDSQDNESTKNLKNNQGGAPNHGKMKDFVGGAFNWVPLYAKMSLLNSSIIYFDMSISPGIGLVTYEQQLIEGNQIKQVPAVTLDVTQHFFLNKWFALRFDYKNRWYTEEITQYRAPTAGRSTSTETNSTTLLMFGATLYY